MKANGIDVRGFGAENDFNTPENICNAAINALNEGYTKYTPAAGVWNFARLYVTNLKFNNLNYEADQTLSVTVESIL